MEEGGRRILVLAPSAAALESHRPGVVQLVVVRAHVFTVVNGEELGPGRVTGGGGSRRSAGGGRDGGMEGQKG